MSRLVVAIPVAPGATDEARVRDLLASLAAHEPQATDVVLVDDDPGAGRDLTGGEPRPPHVSVIPNPRDGRGIPTLGGTAAATLAALAWAHERHPGAWVLRLDTDALVIGPFAHAVADALAPGDGILGSCHRTCNGELRDITAIGAEIRRHRRAIWAWRRPPRRPWWVRPADPHVRAVLRQAADHGYRPGEHCIAAACAISAPLVAALAARGWLDDPARWLNARLGDDMVLGAMARACGLGLRDLHAVFGLRHVGLPDTPDALRTRGFAIIHSVKNDPDVSEAQVRAFFGDLRPIAADPEPRG